MLVTLITTTTTTTTRQPTQKGDPSQDVSKDSTSKILTGIHLCSSIIKIMIIIIITREAGQILLNCEWAYHIKHVLLV